MLQTFSHANITRCRFRLNHASGDGGAIYVATKSELKLFDSEFMMNRAKNGGSIAVYLGDSLIELCSFITENASKDGGCIHLNAANVTVKQSNLSGCKSGKLGGSVYIFQHSTLRLETVMINNSYSTVKGGAIYAKSESEIFVVDSVLTNCSSEDIGGIRCFDTSRMYLESVSISYCSSRSKYGCVDSVRCTFTMNNITITNTDHAITGHEKSTMNIYNTFALNDSVEFLYAESSDVTLWNLNISGTRIKLRESVAEFRHTMFMIQEICPIEDVSRSNITFKSLYLEYTANMSQSESGIMCKQPETVVHGNASGKTKVFEFI